MNDLSLKPRKYSALGVTITLVAQENGFVAKNRRFLIAEFSCLIYN
jgi:hypothetical protein